MKVKKLIRAKELQSSLRQKNIIIHILEFVLAGSVITYILAQYL